MIWKEENCTGTIFHSTQPNSKSIEICFDIECKIDGTIKIVVAPPEFNQEATWLVYMFHSPTDEGRLLLKGQTSDGNDISSHNIYLTQASPQIRQDGEQSILALEFECTELQASVPDEVKGLIEGTSGCIRYDLKGFRCFPAVSSIAEVGEIVAAGAAAIDNYDEITGGISIESKNIGRKTEWVKRSDEQLELILDVFSLAGGRFLEWSRKSVYLENKWVETVFRSTVHRGKPNHPIFHFLNMQPILELAVKKFNKEIKNASGFGIALESFLMPSIYLETQFMTSFMALEHFVNIFASSRTRNTILTEDEFTDFIKPEVIEGLKRAKISLKTSREATAAKDKGLRKPFEAIKGKIDELNRYPFIQNMWKLLNELNVPLDGLSRNEIEKIVQTRNKIIHSGSNISLSKEKQHGLSLLRELLTRIFLTLLEFEGEYSSYLNGHEFVLFPPIRSMTSSAVN